MLRAGGLTLQGPGAAPARALDGLRRLRMLKPGDVAPAFKVKDHLGNEHTLAALWKPYVEELLR